MDHDQRRRHIAGALLRIAEQRGLQHASMREVAAAAEVSVRLVQYYFHTKDELLLAALGYLAEELGARVTRRITELGSPPAPRDVVAATLTAILPTDPESIRLTRTYAAFYSLVLAEPDLTRHGAPHPDLLEGFLANQLRAAQQAGDAHPDLDPELTAAALLALTNGLGSSVLGGQRDADAALRILTYQLDRLYVPR
ncbi:TetR/AcrR family transcriptional regulator [Micromonospora auratinigra]|uniref:TetR/AcrR family transcriptional regulator n=1 Tax=Micromonospora auratinigra TaxID=261654 RepID=UPI0018D3D917|nr:TetR/AcrR family transcriptional regulator [Micromonospora auratinigra]